MIDSNAKLRSDSDAILQLSPHTIYLFSHVCTTGYYINSLAIKFVTDFVLASKIRPDPPGFKLETTVLSYVDELTECPSACVRDCTVLAAAGLLASTRKSYNRAKSKAPYWSTSVPSAWHR